MEERYEFDEVTFLSAFAVGVPGGRTFFLAVGQRGEWVRVWLEKEELQALALAVHQLLLTVPQGRSRASPERESMPLSGDTASRLPSAELEADEIALSYDQERASLDVLAHPSGPRVLERTELHCRATLTQLERFAEEALNVCAAGRQRCPLCGGPIDPSGHICPRNN
ncbi:MAG: hypothetical protein A2147_00445 [Chloroflexi bacterium RBG_16_57_8]|nr:MAG: hypothetical protein A2147_00445 [Chloroflexi bacterium RBG_16_57_8]